MKKILLAVMFIAGVVCAVVLTHKPAQAGSIKTWTNEQLSPSDLNTTFQHIHNNMVGGHGARLVNADVSTSAAIGHSKMATPALLPKAWATLSAACGASPCTIAAGSGVTSITRSGAGLYVVTYPARANVNYFAMVVSNTTGQPLCTAAIAGATSTSVTCFDDAATPVATDGQFNFLLLDDDN